MAYHRTSQNIRAYDIFKAIVTLALIIIILILLLRGCRGGATTPEAAATMVAPTVEKPVETPAVIAPTLNAPQVGANGTVALSGKATPGSNVEVWANGKRLGQAITGADGTWSFAAPFDPGDYNFTARAVDASGATLAESSPLKFNVPTPVSVPVLNAPQVGADGTVTLSGTGTPGSTVEVWANGKRVGQATVGADGAWSFAAPFDPGDYDFTARAVDASGTTLAESSPLKFNVPVLVKAPTLSEPQMNADDSVTFSGTGTPGSTIELWTNEGRLGQATVGDDGVWSFVVPLDRRHHMFIARAVDASGAPLAESEPLVFTFPVKPLTVVSPESGTKLSGDTVTLKGTGQPGVQIEILDNGMIVGRAPVEADGTWSYDYKGEPGSHALAAQYPGNAESASAAVNVEVAAAAKPAPATGVCSAGNIPLGVDQVTTYIVAQCEYMGLIAARTGIKLADLIAANPEVTNINLIYPGQVLNLPPR